MRALDLILTLCNDVVASAGPATEGGHESLDYLPGSMLLGAAAARLYRELTRSDAYTLFHSGLVRFGDAVPIRGDGTPGWPMPLCWHKRKGIEWAPGAQVARGDVRNFQFGRFRDGGPSTQLRAGHVTVDGRMLSVRKTLRMKTAIDPESGLVAEGQLFGYEAISAGQRFLARVEASSVVSDPLWRRLAAEFQAGEFRLGRSRSAEYGVVHVERVSEARRGTVPEGAVRDRQLTLWCLSDVVLVDDHGQVTLEPHPELLGLGSGRVDWENSFLRFRRYAPWNAYRRARDLERQVICRGSVIAVALDEVPAPERLAALAAGVGLWREAGLGRICVNPPLLAEAEPTLTAASASRQIRREEQTASRPDHPLVRWLEAQRDERRSRRDAEKWAREFTDQLQHCYRGARTYAGLPEETAVGPSPSQWGSVLAKAKEAGDPRTLRGALFDGESAMCKSTGEGWQDQFHDNRGVRTFRNWLEDIFPEDLHAMRAFARRALSLARREHGRTAARQEPPR